MLSGRYGVTLAGAEWEELPEVTLEFWLDYNGHWEPENVRMIDQKEVSPGETPNEVEETVTWVAGRWPERFFHLDDPVLVGVTRFRLTGKLSVEQLESLEPVYSFVSTSYHVMERARISAIR